jgi:hypothetical protein
MDRVLARHQMPRRHIGQGPAQLHTLESNRQKWEDLLRRRGHAGRGDQVIIVHHHVCKFIMEWEEALDD